ncbi:endonuclease domain-containing protein [Streptomyces sp. NRRL F-4707]|uniref:endonuclease domain-containing protein n=1 Tax=Streptomyces sp. NRRL F-4707 TaxID=1519496 RepID=UPI003B6426D3
MPGQYRAVFLDGRSSGRTWSPDCGSATRAAAATVGNCWVGYGPCAACAVSGRETFTAVAHRLSVGASILRRVDWLTDDEIVALTSEEFDAWVDTLEPCKVCFDKLWRVEAGRKGRVCPQCRNAERQARRHNLTRARVNAILRVQDDTCPLCGSLGGDSSMEGPSWWHIDHDHRCCSGPTSCGQCVRGLLCKDCNTRGLAWYESLAADLQTWDHANAYLTDPPAHRAEAAVLFHGDLTGVRSRDGSFANWRSKRPL